MSGAKSSWKRPLLIVLATAPIGLAIFSFVFMARSELAFDESRCPYRNGSTRAIAPGVEVREDSRECEASVQEHRWVLLRAGRPSMEIGRRRLDSRFFGEGYQWLASMENDRVRLEIRNPGMDPRVFREPAPDAGSARP